MRLSAADFEREAQARLDPVHYDFFAGAAGDETTHRGNLDAWQRFRLRPRILRGNVKRDLGVTLFGRDLAMPILMSPTAFHRLAHPDGELASASAAASAGTVMIVSMAATSTIEDVVDAARSATPDRDPNLWFQLYLQPDRAFTLALVRRAEAAGVTALVVTVDSPVFGRRERDHRNGFLDLPTGFRCENLVDDTGQVRDIVMNASLTWDAVGWLKAQTRLPVLLKGVLHPEDARLAVEHGVDGLIVSNHGGRQLDGAIASADALPDIAAVVPEGFPLIVDGGVRRGIDVIRALALGATAVGIGRPTVWALAVGGRDGVAELLALLRDEYDQALALCGGASATDLDRTLIEGATR